MAGLAVTMVCGLGINVLIAGASGADALGVFNQILAVYGFLSQLAVAGQHMAALTFIAHHQDTPGARAAIVVSALGNAAVLSVIVCAAGFLLSGWLGAVLGSPATGRGLAIAIPGLFLFSWNKVLIGAVNGAGHMRAYAVLQALRVALMLTGVTAILLWAGRREAWFLALAFPGAEAGVFLAAAAYVQARLTPLVPVRRAHFRWLARHVSFGVKGSVGDILSDIYARVDILLLGYFCSDATVGTYSFASTFAQGLAQLPEAVQRAVYPRVGNEFAAGNRAAIAALAVRVRRTVYPAMAVFGVATMGVFPMVARALGRGDEFGASWAVYAIIAAGVILSAGYRPFCGMLTLCGRPGLHTVVTAATIAGTIALNLVLIPAMGMYGAALATSATYLMLVTFTVLAAHRALGIRL